MDQLKRLIASLSIGQRICIILAAALVGIGLHFLLRWEREADYKPLYSGLAPEDAGAVVQKLKEGAVPYRLSENGTSILVPSAKVAEMRLELASAGLPKTGRIGFELFDKTNFGVTDFAEHINYRRAIEGELERSVMSLAEVEHARVHVTFPKDSVFLESRQAAKASVLVKLRPGARLLPPSVLAITHLVSSAVEGLSPDAVSVLDMRGALLNRPRRASTLDGPEPSEAVLEFQQKIERDLTAKINATLEPLLGSEKFRAGVTVDCDFTSGEQSEETFDPTRSVIVTAQKTEDISGNGGGSGGGSGVPGTASNLPRPTSKAGSSSSGVMRRTENIAYQSSHLIKRTKLPQGSIKRLSVSVLVDQSLRWEGQGKQIKRVLVPPSPEQLKTIRDLVAGVAAISPERGDRLIVETLPFESTLTSEPPSSEGPPPAAKPAQPAWVEQLRKQSKWIYAGGAALLAIILALMFRPKSKKGKPAMLAALPGNLPAGTGQQALEAGAGDPAQPHFGKNHETDLPLLPAPNESRAEVLTNRLRETAVNDPELCAGILRGWLAGVKNSETA